MVPNLSVCMVVSGTSSMHDLRCQTVLLPLPRRGCQPFLFVMFFWFHNHSIYIYVGEPLLMLSMLFSRVAHY